MNKKIIVIVGHTGAGKSTVSSEIAVRFSMPVISFAECGKIFARNNNYERIRDCWESMHKQEFQKGITATMIESVEQKLSESDVLIIDGIYDSVTLREMKNRYSCVEIVYLGAPDEIRFKRIAKRCGYTMGQVKRENNRKERIKSDLGIDKVLSKADYFIDATDSVQNIVQKICDNTFIGKETDFGECVPPHYDEKAIYSNKVVSSACY